MEELEALVGGLEAAADELVAPLNRADGVFSKLESLIASVGEGARAEVVQVVVTVVNTGDVELPTVDLSPPEAPEVGEVGSGVEEIPPAAEDGAATPDAVVLDEQDSSVVVLEEEAPGAPGEATATAEATPSNHVLMKAKAVALELRALLSALAATPERVKQLVVVAKDTLVALPKLGAQAMASAQLKANNPLAGAAVKAEGRAEVERIEAIVAGVQTKVVEIQRQATSLPPKAMHFASRAQKILMGAALTPPPLPGGGGGALARLEVSVSGDSGAMGATEECSSARVGATRRPYQWGWFLVSGLSAAAAGTGAGIYINARQQLSICEDPSEFGCSNYSQLNNQKDMGLVFLSAGTSVMVTTFVGGLVANAGRNREQEVDTGLSCGAGWGRVQCVGAF